MIEVKDLTVKYGGVTSLDGMNLLFERGVCGLIGPNGAGKTTFFNVLSGFVRPASGSVTAFGDDLLKLTHFRRARWGIRRTFQTEQAISDLTVYDNVALPFRVTGRDEESYREEVIELLQWVGLGERMWALPPILSGGEKQRAAIARAVIGRPQLLLADEPTGNVDPSLAQRLLRLFIELNKSGTSVVIATHDIALMNQYNARRLVLHEGRLHSYE